ncbi:hypothetical protein [Segetibacter koreensis]|uniref:hypothetical protein n=1 Tax=Segetibacter koreensis TaxID=398037 RepID=UPI000376C16D|nr:hypothetical protein [Segetibacter koreensis]
MINPSDFWHWFKAYQIDYALILRSDTDSALEVIENINDELHKYCEELSVAVMKAPDNIITMVVTANGNKQYFNEAEDLIKYSPELEGWQFEALKRPVEEDFVWELPNGLMINTEEIWFDPISAEENSSVFGIRLYLKDYELIDTESLQNVTLELVQQMAGEKAFALDIDVIEAAALPNNNEPMIPIRKLSNFINWYKDHVQKN